MYLPLSPRYFLEVKCWPHSIWIHSLIVGQQQLCPHMNYFVTICLQQGRIHEFKTYSLIITWNIEYIPYVLRFKQTFFLYFFGKKKNTMFVEICFREVQFLEKFSRKFVSIFIVHVCFVKCKIIKKQNQTLYNSQFIIFSRIK